MHLHDHGVTVALLILKRLYQDTRDIPSVSRLPINLCGPAVGELLQAGIQVSRLPQRLSQRPGPYVRGSLRCLKETSDPAAAARQRKVRLNDSRSTRQPL